MPSRLIFLIAATWSGSPQISQKIASARQDFLRWVAGAARAEEYLRTGFGGARAVMKPWLGFSAHQFAYDDLMAFAEFEIVLGRVNIDFDHIALGVFT